MIPTTANTGKPTPSPIANDGFMDADICLDGGWVLRIELVGDDVSFERDIVGTFIGDVVGDLIGLSTGNLSI